MNTTPFLLTLSVLLSAASANAAAGTTSSPSGPAIVADANGKPINLDTQPATLERLSDGTCRNRIGHTVRCPAEPAAKAASAPTKR